MNQEQATKLRIVIDSAGDMPEGWAADYDIHIIPINIHFGETTYLQGVDLSNQQFYQMAKVSREFPKTSQPTPQQFIQMYQQIAKPGDKILSLHVTGKLSGTLASAEMAARELQGEMQVFPVDSKSGSAAMGYLAREARLMERGGASLDQILKRMDWIGDQTQIILTLDTMEFARRSGRVKALQAALASLLNVKPVIILRNGELVLGDRVRTRMRALEYVVDILEKRVGSQKVRVAVVHAEDSTAAAILKQMAQERLNCAELIETELSIGVAANLGPGTVGIVAYPLEEFL